MSKNQFFWSSLLLKHDGLDFSNELVFKPNGTTNLIYNSLIKVSLENKKILDLGCGTGALGIGLIDLGCVPQNLFFSDLDKNAVEITKKNLLSLDSDSVVFESDLFNSWEGYNFDIIINDVSGVPSAFSKFFDWFTHAPNQSGPDGTHLTKLVIEESGRYLLPGGVLITPILSLADSAKSTQVLKENFENVEELCKMSYSFVKFRRVVKMCCQLV
jgi:16S rRNA G1207 methylase RsmC